MKYDSEDIDTAARTAWGEDRGGGIQGMLMVLWVIRNRAMDSRWPDSPKDVALQDYQFSAWNEGNPNRAKMKALCPNDMLFDAALGMARAVFEGLDKHDPTNGANHYYSNRIPLPSWARGMKQTAEFNSHLFYRA